MYLRFLRLRFIVWGGTVFWNYVACVMGNGVRETVVGFARGKRKGLYVIIAGYELWLGERKRRVR